MRLVVLTIITGVFFILGCENASKTKEGEFHSLNFSQEDIAKASVSAMFFKPVSDMQVRTTDSLVLVTYDDKTLKIQMDGEQIVWGMEQGRWRNHPEDEILKWEEKGDTLIIHQIFSDSSSVNNRFLKSEFQ